MDHALPDTTRPTGAYQPLDGGAFASSQLTRGPWSPAHQHAGPPVALVCRAIEQAAAERGLTHLSRLTANLLRPVPIDDLTVEVSTSYAGRNVGHFSARLSAQGKEIGLFTALAQRESALDIPEGLPGHPLPTAPKGPQDSQVVVFPFASGEPGYADLVETRVAQGRMFGGPCAIWFRLQHPLLAGEAPSVYQRVAVAADSGNGISAILEISRYSFVNSDLTINLLRRPRGEWICLDARTSLGSDGIGLAESALYDEQGYIGRSTQSLCLGLRP